MPEIHSENRPENIQNLDITLGLIKNFEIGDESNFENNLQELFSYISDIVELPEKKEFEMRPQERLENLRILLQGTLSDETLTEEQRILIHKVQEKIIDMIAHYSA
jgi:hypothetical protein